MVVTRSGWIIASDAPVRRTLATMQAKVRRTIRESETIIRAAISVAAPARERDHKTQAIYIGKWVRAHFHFISDPVDVQVVKDPEPMLWDIAQTGSVYGNCVEAALLVATMLEAIGIVARFRALAFAPGGAFEHVVADALMDDGTWLPLDITRPMGMEPPSVFRTLTVVV